mmetsp:Transcript_6363/g.11292  ORF Transcript_6363/g.11292 Transcript_6363/m.11292 type:complete len:90 (-) Transcript_6363:1200-1469(-)
MYLSQRAPNSLATTRLLLQQFWSNPSDKPQRKAADRRSAFASRNTANFSPRPHIVQPAFFKRPLQECLRVPRISRGRLAMLHEKDHNIA